MRDCRWAKGERRNANIKTFSIACVSVYFKINQLYRCVNVSKFQRVSKFHINEWQNELYIHIIKYSVLYRGKYINIMACTAAMQVIVV